VLHLPAISVVVFDEHDAVGNVGVVRLVKLHHGGTKLVEDNPLGERQEGVHAGLLVDVVADLVDQLVVALLVLGPVDPGALVAQVRPHLAVERLPGEQVHVLRRWKLAHAALETNLKLNIC